MAGLGLGRVRLGVSDGAVVFGVGGLVGAHPPTLDTATAQGMPLWARIPPLPRIGPAR